MRIYGENVTYHKCTAVIHNIYNFVQIGHRDLYQKIYKVLNTKLP